MSLDPDLRRLEQDAIFLIREIAATTKPCALLWSAGKDSTVLLWIARKAFMGHVPFPVVFLDTRLEHPEVYDYRDALARDWKLDLINEPCPPVEDTDPSLPPATRYAARKTLALKTALKDGQYKALFVGIRRDEQEIRNKEKFISPRHADGSWDIYDPVIDAPDLFLPPVPEGGHLRVHPLLPWSEVDIWRYIKAEAIPMVSLYFAKGGQRYRSIGETNISFPVASEAATLDDIIAELNETRIAERAGRSFDREQSDSFERLRMTGYM